MNRLIDLAGKRFGRWTVRYRAENSRSGLTKWHCKCECGTVRDIFSTSLRAGDSTSCGCGKAIDLAGQVFDRWTVIQRGEDGKGRQVRWLCRCECGTEKLVIGATLKNGTSKSCGCVTRERMSRTQRLEFGEASFNHLYRRYKRKARSRNLEWRLSKQEVRYLTKQRCFYCNALPTAITLRPGVNGDYTYNGIDRVDNSLGYIPDNAVPCCRNCNLAKRDMDVTTFVAWVKRAYQNMASDSFDIDKRTNR